MKTLSLAMDDALRERALRYGFLAELDTADGTVRVWSGIGTLSWDGFDWKGLGRLGRISGMGETGEVRTVETRYELAGITDNDELSDFLDTPVRGRMARAWLALMDEDGAVLEDPLQIDESVLDTATISIQDDLSSVLILTGNSAIFDFRRPRALGITNEQQQQDYPGDTGFDRIPTEVADKTVSWTNS